MTLWIGPGALRIGRFYKPIWFVWVSPGVKYSISFCSSYYFLLHQGSFLFYVASLQRKFVFYALCTKYEEFRPSISIFIVKTSFSFDKSIKTLINVECCVEVDSLLSLLVTLRFFRFLLTRVAIIFIKKLKVIKRLNTRDYRRSFQC